MSRRSRSRDLATRPGAAFHQLRRRSPRRLVVIRSKPARSKRAGTCRSAPTAGGGRRASGFRATGRSCRSAPISSAPSGGPIDLLTLAGIAQLSPTSWLGPTGRAFLAPRPAGREPGSDGALLFVGTAGTSNDYSPRGRTGEVDRGAARDRRRTCPRIRARKPRAALRRRLPHDRPRPFLRQRLRRLRARRRQGRPHGYRAQHAERDGNTRHHRSTSPTSPRPRSTSRSTWRRSRSSSRTAACAAPATISATSPTSTCGGSRKAAG